MHICSLQYLPSDLVARLSVSFSEIVVNFLPKILNIVTLHSGLDVNWLRHKYLNKQKNKEDPLQPDTEPSASDVERTIVEPPNCGRSSRIQLRLGELIKDAVRVGSPIFGYRDNDCQTWTVVTDPSQVTI